MSPIYKKKNPDDIANYRPITLLNTDYKIYTKAISVKLAGEIHEIIHTDQAGFIQGRSIFDQVKTTKLVIGYMNQTNTKGAAIALDQEKAYDKILHGYLWEVLRNFGFPEHFINIVRALYDHAVTMVLINGELSDPFNIWRGMRQGDPLLCLLFNIAIEPLAEMIRKSAKLKGIQIPHKKDTYLRVKLFADDTTVFMSEHDSIDDLQEILDEWCRSSGAKFNIEKTEIIPLGNTTQRDEIANTRKLKEGGPTIPEYIHIMKDGEPVRVLGVWLGNNIDQSVTWAPIVEDCHKRLKRWGTTKHSLEGRRLILQMQVAGVTQYLTKVQGMPGCVEDDLNRAVRKFIWNNEKADTVNLNQMAAPHDKGSKKVLDVSTQNKAIHLTWLKAYLNIGPDRPTWSFFADALISMDIPPSHKIDEDPESRVMPIIQTWETRTRGSNLPEDLKEMLKVAREFNVQLGTANPSSEVKGDLPLWYHAKSDPTAKKVYKTREAKCLRQKHHIKLVKEAASTINGVNAEHRQEDTCTCETCRRLRAETKCPHPNRCINMLARLIQLIKPKWNPKNTNPTNNTTTTTANEEREEEEGTLTFDKDNKTKHLRDVIKIFGPMRQTHQETPQEPQDEMEGGSTEVSLHRWSV
jgi:hypothetical protein